MYLPTVDGKYFRSTPPKESEHKLRNPTPPHPQFNVECSASGVWFCFLKPRLQHWTGGCGGRAEHNNSFTINRLSQQSLRKYFPSTVAWAGLSLAPNIQKSGPTRSIYNASEWNALGAWRQCFLHPVCCYSFSKVARPQKHQAGHLEYKENPIFIATLETDVTKIRNKNMREGCIEILPHSTTIWSGSNKRCTVAC